MDPTADELRRRIEEQREDIGRDLTVIGDHVSPNRIAERQKERMRRFPGRMRDRIMGTVDTGTSRLQDAASGMGDSTSGTMHSLSESAQQVPERVSEQVAGSPLAAGLIAFGAGLIAASFLPATSKEQELGRQLQPTLEHAASSAADSAKELAADLRPAAQEEAQALKDEAKQAAQQTTQAASEHAGAAAGEVKEAARQGATS